MTIDVPMNRKQLRIKSYAVVKRYIYVDSHTQNKVFKFMRQLNIKICDSWLFSRGKFVLRLVVTLYDDSFTWTSSQFLGRDESNFLLALARFFSRIYVISVVVRSYVSTMSNMWHTVLLGRPQRCMVWTWRVYQRDYRFKSTNLPSSPFWLGLDLLSWRAYQTEIN